MKTVVFFVRHFTERGTEVSVYDYAHYNEEILGNKSIIFCFTLNKMKELNFPTSRASYNKFKNRFELIEIDHIYEIQQYIKEYSIDIFYTQTCGDYVKTLYEFDNKELWSTCKTIKHCVFVVNGKESDYYCTISNFLNTAGKTNYPVLPYMVTLPSSSENIRKSLNIPEDATVFGGYGGEDNFDIKYAQLVVNLISNNFPNIYFLFANFHKFCPEHPNIIHLPTILDPLEKTKFINTCDAMIWARSGGETFGLAIAEFSIKNKPVIATKVGELAHVELLKDKALWYASPQELFDILINFNRKEASLKDWNAYTDYTPEKVMTIFKNIIDTLLDAS